MCNSSAGFINLSLRNRIIIIEIFKIFAYDHKTGATPRNGNGISAPLDWGFIAPTDNFLSEFEANDPRLLYTVDVSKKAVYKLLGATNTIYKGNDDAPGNKLYIRMADALLWKAEAHNELGDYSSAIALINKVRERARTGLTIEGTPTPSGTLPFGNRLQMNFMIWVTGIPRIGKAFT